MTLLDVGCGWGGALELARREVRRQRHRNHAEPQPVSNGQLGAWPNLARQRDRRDAAAGLGKSSTTPSTASCPSAPSRPSRRIATRRSSSRPTAILPDDGRMLLHTILAHTQSSSATNGIKLTVSDPAVHASSSARHDLPRRRDAPAIEDIHELARRLGPAPCRTAAAALRSHASTCGPEYLAKANKDEAIPRAPPDAEVSLTTDTCILTGCADFFRRGITNFDFTLVVPCFPRRPCNRRSLGASELAAFASRFFSASTSKSAGGHDKSRPSRASTSSSVMASRAVPLAVARG